MKEGRGEGGEKPPSSGFSRKNAQTLFGLRLKKGKRHEQALPCSAIPSTPVAPKASQTRLDELTCAPCFMTP